MVATFQLKYNKKQLNSCEGMQYAEQYNSDCYINHSILTHVCTLLQC